MIEHFALAAVIGGAVTYTCLLLCWQFVRGDLEERDE